METWQDIKKSQTIISAEEMSLIDTLSFLQAQRIKQGLSQAELKRINMTQPQLAKLEELDSTPTLSVLKRYATGLRQ